MSKVSRIFEYANSINDIEYGNDIDFILKKISAEGEKLYVVGGSVRDELLGKTPHDYDLVTTMDIDKCKEIFNVEKTQHRGESVLAFIYVNDNKYETACLGGEKSIEDRLVLSDLTMNALAKDLETGEIIDPLNGKEDIQNKIIRASKWSIDNYREGRLSPNAIRVFRFYAKLGWDIDFETLDALRDFSKKTKGVFKFKYGRALKEWESIVNGKYADKAIALLRDFGFNSYVDEFSNEDSDKITERVSSDGKYITAWSSSKDNNLFNYYMNNNLKYGINAGSAYGFATYLVTEPPFSEDAKIGYSDSFRKSLYGNNIYEFEISTSRLIILDYEDFKKTSKYNPEKTNEENFVRVQIQELGLPFTEKEIEACSRVREDGFTTPGASSLFKICSRYFYQGHRGNLRTPCDGFQYTGKNDGKTLVIWNSNRLIPVRCSHDNGQTWENFDRSSKEFYKYLNKANIMDYKYHEEDYKKNIFNGNITKEKMQIYRLLMSFNSNDGEDENGNPLGMSPGIFLNIKINDDKTIDAEFRSNLPMVDGYNHFYRISSDNQFINKIYELGYKFGKLNCGLKLGSEREETDVQSRYEKSLFPLEVTGGLALSNVSINKSLLEYIPTKIDTKYMRLSMCQIEEDVFDGWEVHFSSKKSWTSSEELYNELKEKYSWTEENLAPSKPVKSTKSRKKTK